MTTHSPNWSGPVTLVRQGFNPHPRDDCSQPHPIHVKVVLQLSSRSRREQGYTSPHALPRAWVYAGAHMCGVLPESPHQNARSITVRKSRFSSKFACDNIIYLCRGPLAWSPCQQCKLPHITTYRPVTLSNASHMCIALVKGHIKSP